MPVELPTFNYLQGPLAGAFSELSCRSAAVLDLAATLCLDAAAFTFVDDSPLECADVAARAAPRGVAVVHVPREPEAVACSRLAERSREEPR